MLCTAGSRFLEGSLPGDGSRSPQGLAGSACRLAGSCSQTALNIACSHTVAGIELVAPEHGPHTRQGTEQLSAPEPGREAAAPILFSRLPQGPSGLAGGALLFLPSLLPLSRGRFTFGWSCRPRTPWLGCVHACDPSEIVFMCIFPGSVHSGHQILKGSCPDAGRCVPHRHPEHREQQAAWPPPLPRTDLQGQLRAAPTEAAAWARSMS